jgi:magnesium-transporting ATPase (P-type)
MSLSPIANETRVKEQRKSANIRDKFCIVLDGAALSILLANPNQTKKLLSVMAHPQCEAAVFCRVNPKQKGLIVKSCRDRLSAGRVLAIGDGANDISMIKEAHVGIGIYGEEGWQAAGAADYAITRFKDLYRLLFIHGRWNYMRITFFITFFMYKNYAFTFLQFWLASLSAWSGQSVLNDVCLLTFNSVFLVAPLFAAGLFDTDIHPDADRPSKRTMMHPPSVTDESWYVEVIPRLYKPGQENRLFKSKRVFAWLTLGLVHSVIIFFAIYLSWAYADNPAINERGFNGSFSMMEQAIFTALLVALSILHSFMIRQWTWIYLLMNVAFNLGLYVIFVIVYDKITLNTYTNIAGATFSNWNFWFTLGITLAFCVIPLIILKLVRHSIYPSLIDVISSKRLSDVDIKRKSAQLSQIKCDLTELAVD